MHGMEAWDEINRITPVGEGQGVFCISASIFQGFANISLALFDDETHMLEEYCSDVNYTQDVKMNHRFPNKLYHTMSQTAGRKVSKMGYCFVDSIENLNKKRLLCAKVESQLDVVIYMIPIQLSLTSDMPVGVCELWLNRTYWNQFSIKTWESDNGDDDGIKGWWDYIYYANIDYGSFRRKKKITLKMQKTNIPDNFVVTISDVIDIKSLSKDRVLVL